MGIEHAWCHEYEQCRYLREITEEGLKSRYDALIGNLWSTDATGNVTPPRNENTRRQLLRLTVHTILEQMQREGTSYFDFSETKLRETASASYKPPQLRNPFRGLPSCFAKFCKRKHIHDAFNRGRLRIAPANVYDDPSLNTAQADKELEHYSVTPNEHLMFRLMGLDSEGKEVELPVKPKELFRYLMVQNFYVWCCGFGYDARLFHDFEAESVLVVRDMEAFTKRFSDEVGKQILDARAVHGPLNYYDPYTTKLDQLTPIFSKNFRYLYQNEYRFAWKMPAESELEPFFVELGPLKDIAELYELV